MPRAFLNRSLRFGYAPHRADLGAPADRRRFATYARARNLDFEVVQDGATYDVVVLSEKADITRWARHPRDGTRIVYDFINSYLAVDRASIKNRLRGVGRFVAGQYSRLQDPWRAQEDMCRRADAVVCATEEQRAAILPFCAPVHIVLDVMDAAVRDPKVDYGTGPSDRPFRVVWEGLPENAWTLGILRAPLKDLLRERQVVVDVVTAPSFHRYLGRYFRTDTASVLRRALDGIPHEIHPWDEATLPDIVRRADLAVIPLPLDDPLYRGKPANKLQYFWRMGVPVIASRSPAYARAMASAGLSWTCATEADWTHALRSLAQDPAARAEAGVRGRRYAETVASEESILARWDAVMASVLG